MVEPATLLARALPARAPAAAPLPLPSAELTGVGGRSRLPIPIPSRPPPPDLWPRSARGGRTPVPAPAPGGGVAWPGAGLRGEAGLLGSVRTREAMELVASHGDARPCRPASRRCTPSRRRPWRREGGVLFPSPSLFNLHPWLPRLELRAAERRDYGLRGGGAGCGAARSMAAVTAWRGGRAAVRLPPPLRLRILLAAVDASPPPPSLSARGRWTVWGPRHAGR